MWEALILSHDLLLGLAVTQAGLQSWFDWCFDLRLTVKVTLVRTEMKVSFPEL